MRVQPPSIVPVPHQKPIQVTQACSLHAPNPSQSTCCLPCRHNPSPGHWASRSGPGWRKVPCEGKPSSHCPCDPKKAHTCVSGLLPIHIKTPPRAPAACPAATAPPQGAGRQVLVQGGERFQVRVKSPSTALVPHREAHVCDSGLLSARPMTPPRGPAACLPAAPPSLVISCQNLVQSGESST